MSEFRSKDISLKIQKKLLSRFAKKNVAKMFIDEVSAHLLDNLHKLVKLLNNNSNNDKIIKYIIKIIIKIAILNRSDQFSDNEVMIANKLKQQFRKIAMTIVSYHQIDFTLDCNFLIQLVNDCKLMILNLVKTHLSEKSLQRVEHIFEFFTNTENLDQFFRAKDGSELNELKHKIMNDLNMLLENGTI